MITVTTFSVLTGRVIVHVPVRYRALIAQYAGFGQDAPLAEYGSGGWNSMTEYRTWLQLPGVTVEKTQ